MEILRRNVRRVRAVEKIGMKARDALYGTKKKTVASFSFLFLPF